MIGPADTALARWIGLVTRRPVLVLVLALALAAVALGYTVRGLGVSTDTMEMISPEVPFRQEALEFRRTFPTFDEPIVAVIDAPTPEAAERAATALTEALWADDEHFSAVEYVAGEPFFVRHGLLFLDVDELAELTDQLAAAQPLVAALAEDPTLRGIADFVGLAVEAGGEDDLPAELGELFDAMAAVVEAQIAGEPKALSWRSLMAAAGDAPSTRRLVLAQPRLNKATLAPAADAIRALRDASGELGLAGDERIRVRLTGKAVLNAEELQSVSAGATLAGGLTAIAVTVLLIWGLRSVRLIAATLATLAIGLIVTAGFATLAVGRLNLISVAFAVLFVGLGVDFGIHFTLRYREALARGADTIGALCAAATGVGGALSLTALCAALAFLSFVPTDYLGLAELGVISAGGMVIAWLASLTLLPALLRLMPLRRRAAPVAWEDDPSAHVHPESKRSSLAVLGVALVAAVASLVALPYVTFDFDPLNLKDPETESVSTFLDLAADDTISPYSIDVLAEDLGSADAMAERLRQLPSTGRVLTLSSFVPEDQGEKLEAIDLLAFSLGPVLDPERARPLDAGARRGAFEDLRAGLEAAGAPAAARLAGALDRFAEALGPTDDALAALEDRLTRFLPDLLDRLRRSLEADPVGLEDLPPDLVSRWLAADGRARLLVQPDEQITSNGEVRDFANAVSAEVPSATGTPIVITEAGRAVVEAFRQASAYALIMITAVLAVVLRSLRDMLLVLVPLGLAVLYTAASTVVLGLAFNFANVIVLPLLLGLGVSGAIHVVMRERQTVRRDLFATSTPRAVLFSALTTIASFGSLAVSDHRGLASMGLLLTISILWSLVATLVVLPSLLAIRRAHAPQLP